MSFPRFTRAIFLLASAGFALLLVFSIAKGIPDEFAPATRIALGVLICLSLITSRLPPGARLKLTFLCASTGLTLLVANAVLELADSPKTLSYAALSHNVPFDLRSRREVVVEMRANGLDAYPWVPGGLLGEAVLQIDGQEVYPMAGVSDSTTVFCNELGEYSIYHSDEHGFNNPMGIWKQDRIDIVAIGDSFTHGGCVQPGANAADLIRQSYSNTLNLGASGTGTLEQLAIMKEYLGALKPKAVLWFFYEDNDLDNSVDAYEYWQRNSVLKRYLEGEYRQGLIEHQPNIDRELRTLVDKRLSEPKAEIFKSPLALKIVILSQLRHRLLRTYQRVRGCDAPPEVLELFERTVKEGRDYVNSLGSDLYFVYLPAWERYGDPDNICIYGDYDTKFYDQVIAVSKDAGIPVIDVKAAFDSHPDTLSLFPFRVRSHYNEAGYKLVAETVLKSIFLEDR